MKTALRILALILSSQLLYSCSGTASNSNGSNQSSANLNAENPAKTANDNSEELGMIVSLPFEPVEVVWKEDTQQNQKKLIAVMRFTPEQAATITDNLRKSGEPVPASLEVNEWYPTELISQGELGEDSKLKGSSYPPNDFLQPPYSEGKITRIEGTDYFILELAAN